MARFAHLQAEQANKVGARRFWCHQSGLTFKAELPAGGTDEAEQQGGRHRRHRPEHLIATIGPSGLITTDLVATSSQSTQCMRTIVLLLLRGFLVSLAAFALAGCGGGSLRVPQPDAAELSFAVSPGACWENDPQDCTIEQQRLTGGCLICQHECGCAVRDRASYVGECDAAVAPPDNAGWLEHVVSAGVELRCPEPWFWQLRDETDAQTVERFKVLLGGKGCIIFQPESPHPSDYVFMGWGGTADRTYDFQYLTDTHILKVWDGKAVRSDSRPYPSPRAVDFQAGLAFPPKSCKQQAFPSVSAPQGGGEFR